MSAELAPSSLSELIVAIRATAKRLREEGIEANIIVPEPGNPVEIYFNPRTSTKQRRIIRKLLRSPARE